MSQSLSRRSFLKCAGSGAVSLAAALLTGVSAAAAQPRVANLAQDSFEIAAQGIFRT